jgi:tRNA-dihydrouridine synthase B
MAGVTDTVFRRFIKNASLFTPAGAPTEESRPIDAPTTNQQSGCGLIMTEFTSADGLSRMRESKRKRYLTYYDDEHPISAQLFGSNPATLADSARIVQDAGFDLVDLNLGCPAKRVVACNGGSGLLRDLPLIETIFKAVRAAVTIPFTVKFRMGWNDATSSASNSRSSPKTAASTPSPCTPAPARTATPARPAGSTSPR